MSTRHDIETSVSPTPLAPARRARYAGWMGNRASLHQCGEVVGLRADDLAGDFDPQLSLRGLVRRGVLVTAELTPRCWSKYQSDVRYMRACYEQAGLL